MGLGWLDLEFHLEDVLHGKVDHQSSASVEVLEDQHQQEPLIVDIPSSIEEALLLEAAANWAFFIPL